MCLYVAVLLTPTPAHSRSFDAIVRYKVQWVTYHSSIFNQFCLSRHVDLIDYWLCVVSFLLLNRPLSGPKPGMWNWWEEKLLSHRFIYLIVSNSGFVFNASIFIGGLRSHVFRQRQDSLLNAITGPLVNPETLKISHKLNNLCSVGRTFTHQQPRAGKFSIIHSRPLPVKWPGGGVKHQFYMIF